MFVCFFFSFSLQSIQLNIKYKTFSVFNALQLQLTLAISISLISNNRLSRLELKIWSLSKHENLTKQVKSIVEKRRNCSLRAISPLFHNIFNISLTSRIQIHIYLLNVVDRIIFSAVLQICYVELRIFRSISKSPLEFQITRVECI